MMEGPLGVCIQGRHPLLKGGTHVSTNIARECNQSYLIKSHAQHGHPELVGTVSSKDQKVVDDFIAGEQLGTEVIPKCGGCKCAKCPIPGHTFSFKEEQELTIIRDNLHYDPEGLRWITAYPWISDPSTLPNNYCSALATLKSTERRLKAADSQWAEVYTQQIYDMVHRNVAKKLSDEEMAQWCGPVFYISHLAVVNAKSTTTPVRIVFNSSQKYKGVSLNSYLAKGPDAYLNNLLGILLRWREERVVLISDIKKMYNSIYITETEQHCHRFLWRDLEARDPDTYVMLRVNMGDRPAAAISTEAIYKTADLFSSEFPRVAELLQKSTYVDDIIHSIPTLEEARQLQKDTDEVLRRAGFVTKGWIVHDPATQGDSEGETGCQRVLGVFWDPREDHIIFDVPLKLAHGQQGSSKRDCNDDVDHTEIIPDSITRRKILEQVMRIYDPLGILSPFTLKAKILLQQTWALKLGWDDPIPSSMLTSWRDFFQEMSELSTLKYDRCLKPMEAVGQPILVLLSDASDHAYGAAAYIRWQLDNGSFWCRLIMAKSRVAPIKQQLSVPQKELNGAVMSKRIRKVLEQELRFKFSQVYHLLDSETVLSMINKLSTRFRVYEGVRIGEIQAATNGNLSEWFWIAGVDNIADWLTREKSPHKIAAQTEWWQGPAFLSKPIDEWDIRASQECNVTALLSGEKPVSTLLIQTSNYELLDYAKFSCASKAVWTLALICVIAQKRSFQVDVSEWRNADKFREATNKIVQDVQRHIGTECKKGRKSRYAKLLPWQEESGVWKVGKRLSQYNAMAIDPTSLPSLLPEWHWFTLLLMREAHIQSGHRGRDATLARFRQDYWTPSGMKLARKVINECQLCKLRDSRLFNQLMGNPPPERLKPYNPPFDSTMVDLFGPYTIRGEVQKRISGKAYGVIFTDLASRAVHIEGVFGYDTASFMMALTRFVCMRGWPRKLFSDPGSQLVGASKELVTMWKEMEKSSVYKLSAQNGTTWVFGPADSPWHQGAVESLVKAAKRCFMFAFNSSRLTPSEFLTVCANVTNILNERPIGTLSSAEPTPKVLTPNCLLIGRPYALNPGGWSQDISVRRRLEVIDQISESFWKRWLELYPPTLMHQRKWLSKSENVKPGDVVVVMDSNSLRGEYRIALVKEAYKGTDNQVRKVALEYKNFKTGEKLHEYKGSKAIKIYRSVRRLAPLVSADLGAGA
jgi:hypothetical protein